MSMPEQSPLSAAARLVVVAPNWLGDAVMALPAIADLRRTLPAAKLAVAARASIAPLFTLVSGVDEVVTFGDRAWWPEIARALSARSFDAAVLLPNSFRSALAARWARIQERVGFATDLRGPLLTCAIARPARV